MNIPASDCPHCSAKMALPDGCDFEPQTVAEAHLQQEMRKLLNHIVSLEKSRDQAVRDHIRCCETNNHNARMYMECKQVLAENGISMPPPKGE